MRSFFAFALFIALAGRALALDIQFAVGDLAIIPASQLLDIPDGQLKTDCQPSCDPATQAIQGCGDTDDACLCSNATVTAIVVCEQCMLTELINTNKKMPDPRAGSNPALAAYAAACLASQNVTLSPLDISLRLPPSWDGPFDVQMNLPSTIVTVIVGAVLGVSSILMLSNM